MKRISISITLFFLLFVLSFSFPLSVFAADNTFEVDTTNWTDDASAGDGNCADAVGDCSLKAAIQEANATAGSDEITFAAALYGGGAATITTSGIPNITDADVTITGPGGGNIIVDYDGSTGLIAESTADNFSVSGMTLTNSGDGACLAFLGMDGATASDNIISVCHTEGISLNTGTGAMNNITVSGNTVSDCDESGSTSGNALEAVGANVLSNASITGNTFTGVAGAGTVVFFPDGDDFTGIIFTGNEITGGADGVIAYNIASANFSDNTITSPADDGMAFSDIAVLTVAGNTVTGATEEGIEVDNSSLVTVGGADVSDGNTVSGVIGGDGISLDTIATGTVQNNSSTVVSGGRSYVIASCTTCNVTENTGVNGSDGNQTMVLYSGSGNTVDGNTITVTGTGALTAGIAAFETLSAITDNTVSGDGTDDGIGILVIGNGTTTTMTGNDVSNIGVAYQFGASAVAIAGGYTMDSTNTLSNVGTGLLFEKEGTLLNTISDVTIPGTVTTHISYDVGEGNTSYLDNVDFDYSKVTVTSGTLDVNFDVRAYVEDVEGSPVEGSTVTATDTESTETSLGDTDATGYTSYTSLDAYSIESTGKVDEKNPYSLSATSGLDDGVTASATGESLASQNESITVTFSSACSDGVDNDGDGLIDLADPGCEQNPSDNDESHSYSGGGEDTGEEDTGDDSDDDQEEEESEDDGDSDDDSGGVIVIVDNGDEDDFKDDVGDDDTEEGGDSEGDEDVVGDEDDDASGSDDDSSDNGGDEEKELGDATKTVVNKIKDLVGYEEEEDYILPYDEYDPVPIDIGDVVDDYDGDDDDDGSDLGEEGGVIYDGVVGGSGGSGDADDDVRDVIEDEIEDAIDGDNGRYVFVILGEYEELDDDQEVEVLVEPLYTDDEFDAAKEEAEAEGKKVIVVDEQTDLDGDRISDLVQVMYDIPLFDTDADDDGYSNSEEIFMGFSPREHDSEPVLPSITNLDGKTTGLWPSFRVIGKSGDNVEITLVDAETDEETLVGSVTLDDRNKGELNTEYPLFAGEYYAVPKGVDGFGDAVKFTVVDDLSLMAPRISKTEYMDFSDEYLLRIGYIINMDLMLVETAHPDFDALAYAQGLHGSGVDIIEGYAKPGTIVYVTWKSVILSSVVIADANEQGYFESYIPDTLPDGEHEFLVYAVDPKGNIVSSVTSYLFRK